MSIYYAIEFEKNTIEKLKQYQLKAKQNSYFGDFVQPETFHITILFCAGDGTDYSRTDYINALDKFSEIYKPKKFEIQLENYGQFHNGGEGSVVWVGVKNSFPLYNIKKNLEQTIRNMNVKIEKSNHKTYTPHITMGYDVKLKEDFNCLFEDNEEITIKSLVLWDSFKANDTHVYNKIHEIYFE